VTDQASLHSDVLVVGGGVIGVACAYYLARAGLSIRIIERDAMGAGASHGNCGLLFVSDLPPLCAPGAVAHELRRIIRGTSPLYISPRLDPSLAFWLLRFAAKCNPRHLNHAIAARDAILRTSGDLFDDFFQNEPLDCDFDRQGVLMAFIDPATMEAYAKTNRLLEPYGRAATFFDRKRVKKLEPALGDRVCGGWHHPVDSHLRPERLMASWTRLIRRYDVIIDEGCRLDGILIKGGTATAVLTNRGRYTADQIVLATGVWTPAIGRRLGVRIPVQPGKGYSITMQRPSNCPRVPCYLYERNVVVTPWASGFRLGGTMEFSGFDNTLNPHRLGNLETSAALYLNTPLGRRVTERWTGLRPMSVDDLPIIDRMPGAANLYLATGHGMLGLSTATGTGRLIADMILGNSPPFDPRPFSIRRFA
jgi:D-amino-acid dehydrogenase